MAGSKLQTSQDGSHLTAVGDFLIDRMTIRVWRSNQPLQLSLKQFRLLDVFMRHPDQPISRDTLKRLVWGPNSEIAKQTVDAEIVRLRRALGSDKRGPIWTVRNQGYFFQER